MDAKPFVYDIFISYAREDYDWVYNYLFIPLTQCTMPGGKKPKIFLDQSEMGVKIGEDFLEALAKAILTSHRVVLVYSRVYFTKGMTMWELTKALQADPTGRDGKINPLLLEHEAETQIPYAINHIHYIDVQKQPSQWLQRLIDNIGLTPLIEKRTIRIESSFSDIIVNNTMQPISIVLSDHDKPVFEEETVEISASEGEIQGTCKQKTIKGKVVFDDLSFKFPAKGITISVKAPGYDAAISNVFSVVESQDINVAQSLILAYKKSVVISYGANPEQTAVYCFEDARALAVFDGQYIHTYNHEGKSLGRLQLHAEIKSVKARHEWLVIIDWKGNLFILGENGDIRKIPLYPDDMPFSIPGGLSLTDTHVLVGMWNGDLFSVDLKTGNKTVLFTHNAGIQHFINNGVKTYLCDFEGNFIVYTNAFQTQSMPIERSIVGMHLFENYVIVVGESKPYQFSFRENQMLSSQFQSSPTVFVIQVGKFMLSLDNSGSGLLRDEELFIRKRFHVTAGARPFSAGISGNDIYCSFVYPDKRYTLLKNEKIVYTNVSGVLSFNSDMSMIAAGLRDGIIIRNGSWLHELNQGAMV